MGTNSKAMSDLIRSKWDAGRTETLKPDPRNKSMNDFIRSKNDTATNRFNRIVRGLSPEPPQEPKPDPQYEYLQNCVNALDKLLNAEKKLEEIRKESE